MSHPKNPKPVKLLMSILYANEKDCMDAVLLAKKKWGPLDHEYPQLTFTHTHYYEKEMGQPLYRCFMSFKNLIERERLVEIKLWTNELEQAIVQSKGKRTINVDPGYLNDAQLVLATGKNFSHRVYLEKGIFADLTLVFMGKNYQSMPWTYPDYKSEPLSSILMEIRKSYLKALYDSEN